MSRHHLLVGSWRLDRWVMVDAAGERPSPYFGGKQAGYVVYGPDGICAMHLEHADRALRRDDDPSSAGDDEIVAATRGVLSYMARYVLDEEHDRLVHTIFACTWPNWVGMQQTRYVEACAQHLTLRTPPVAREGLVTFAELAFTRVRATPRSSGA